MDKSRLLALCPMMPGCWGCWALLVPNRRGLSGGFGTMAEAVGEEELEEF